ncbi:MULTISPECIES: sensor histidine kinase [Actinomadura]|uniref:Sensor histidine kinase n=1 Tax=Actinomadura yumaensis TaxID=111807 RepID=A0ABW2CTC2_9ACTN|nr:sensor histidine kinase [Actinomadura sp. J1-007]MWK37508.1 sensor histidine kinase [Actinomadura sp. J1-007]
MSEVNQQVSDTGKDPGRRRPRLDLETIDRNGPGPQSFAFWAIVLIWPLIDVLQGRSDPTWLAGPLLAALAAVYIAAVVTTFNARYRIGVPIALVVVQAVLTTVGTIAFDGRWFTAFPLLGLSAGVVVGHLSRSGEGPEFTMLFGIGGVSLLSALVGWSTGSDTGSILGIWYGTVTAGLVSAIIMRLFLVIGMLRQAREELAHAAVAQERLRFSRDLHDLLGHTLSLMVVKAQAVRRLAERDPKTAAEQAADIETVGREALTEVRQAVSGYRGRGLSSEIDAARTALADSGIDATVRRAGPSLSPEPDALLGWAVREGVTNVIRHSGARHCEILVRHDGDRAVLEIRDDGPGEQHATPSSAEQNSHAPDVAGRGLSLGPGGHGLRGLAERMEAADGTVEAGPDSGGGFVLTVTVPLGPAA